MDDNAAFFFRCCDTPVGVMSCVARFPLKIQNLKIAVIKTSFSPSFDFDHEMTGQ